MDDTVKKLLMHGILRTDMAEEAKPPFSLTEEREILNKFADPEFGDTFNLSLTKTNFEPGKLFSKKSLEKFLHILRLYVGGRILGNYNKTNKEPEVVYVTIKVEHLTKKEYEARMKD